MAPSRPSHREDFEIAIVCALPREYDAVSLIFDEFWDKYGDQYGRAIGDLNNYKTGRIGKYNVVLALLSHMGKVNAASAAAGVRSSYGGIRLALLVGICGGAPRAGGGKGKEILLGDVVISNSVVQSDFGRQYSDKFVRKNTLEDNLSKPNKDVRNFLVLFETQVNLRELEQRASHFLQQIQASAVRGKWKVQYEYPGVAADKLFKWDYHHKHHGTPQCDCAVSPDSTCELAKKSSCDDLGCNDQHLVQRARLEAKLQLGQDKEQDVQEPAIHVGSVASADRVMKSGSDRDRVAKEEGVIAFEMEGAGVWEELPCIIVKGVCDYSDSHKNKNWQDFAAATAAAASKALLERYIQTDKVSLTVVDASQKGGVTQGGSTFTSEVKGKTVRQGNEAELSSPNAPRNFIQGGSDFGGNVQAEASVNQGNILKF
jgi:nucleoside phosphorylase